MITGKILGKTYVINGISVDVSELIPDMSADIYYEVVRLIDGKVLFLEDHLNRLRDSISGTDLPFPGSMEIFESLNALISNNDFKIGNIRICLQSGEENQCQHGQQQHCQCMEIGNYRKVHPDPPEQSSVNWKYSL